MPVGKLTVVPDFLPPPEKLFPPKDRVRITIELDGDTIMFFRTRAQLMNGKYQRVIREVLKRYAEHHSKKHAA